MSVRQIKNATIALKWSYLSELLTRFVTPLTFLLIARILVPEDFGIVTSATMVITFCQFFWEGGMGQAVIQFQGDRDAAANVAFWTNTIMGGVIAVVLVLTADIFAETVFKTKEVGPVLKIMSVQVLFSALISVQNAILKKDLKYDVLFKVRLYTVVVSSLVSVSLAYTGITYWSLVAGTLVGQFLQIMILWRLSSWRPKFHFDVNVFRVLFKFGGWVAMTGVLSWLFGWADSLIVSMRMGPHELGLFRTGYVFVVMIFGTLFGPLIPVVYSFFCANQEKKISPDNIMKGNYSVFLISLFIAVILGIGSDLFATVFSQKWAGVSIVITMLSITHALSNRFYFNNEAYRANGNSKTETLIMLIALPLYIATSLISIRYGLKAMLISRVGSVILFGMVINFVFEKKYLKTSILEEVRKLLILFLLLGPIYLIRYLMFLKHLSAITGWLIIAVCLSCYVWYLVQLRDVHFYFQIINKFRKAEQLIRD